MPAPRELLRVGGTDADNLGQYCATDTWRGDLETGLFMLNSTARQILGVGDSRGHGLLTLIQCFDPADRYRLIDLFERAASEPMRFSFVTTIARHGKIGQSVFCIGRSSGHDAGADGELRGVFIFPHL